MFRTILMVSIIALAAACGEQSEPEDVASPEDTTPQPLELYEGETVITVGDISFSAEEIYPDFRRILGDSQRVENKLNAVISRLLILNDAYDRGFDQLEDHELFCYERSRERLQQEWFNRILEEKVQLPPDTVQQYYSRLGSRVIFSAINVPEKTLSDSLRQLVLAGGNMRELAWDHTNIDVEQADSGVVGPIELMETSPQDLALLGDLQPGEISSPDSSRSGWRFVRLDSIYEAEVPPLDSIRSDIEEFLLARMKMEYKHVLFDSLRTLRDFRIEPGVPELIASRYSGEGLQYDEFSPEEEDMMVYTYEDGGRTAYELVYNISNLPPVPYNDPGNPEWVEKYARLLGLYDMMALEARNMGMDTLPLLARRIREIAEDNLLDIYYRRAIYPRTLPEEEELRELYENTPEEELMVPETRVFRTISALGDEQLELLEGIMGQNEDVYSRADELTPVDALLASGETILTRPLRSDEIPAPWDSLLFTADLNETVVCSVAAQRVIVFDLVEILPEHTASLREVEERLREDLIPSLEEEVISALVDSLTSEYHIETNEDFFTCLMQTRPAVHESGGESSSNEN